MPTAVSMQQLEIRLTDCLAALEAKLRSCANAGYTDENKRSEVIARDILNILLGRTYELEPRINSPGFDLRDSDEMSLVQITSTDTIRKVTDCLRTTTERVAKETDLRGYELKILFLTTDSETTKKLKTDTIKRLPKLGLDLSCIDFDPEINLLDFNDLIRPLRENHVTREQMTQLSDLMDKYWPHIASQPAVTDRVQEIINQYADNFTAPLFMHRGSKTVTLQNMYVEPSFDDAGDLAHQFDTVTDSIHDFLWHKSREKIMVIEGDAAIGKTSLVSWMCYHAQAGDEEAQKLFQNSPVVCVRLRELEFEENEESADPILQYLNIPDAREFVRRYPDAILILDGADELGMVSSLNASRIGQFILNSCNSLAVRKLIVTSRPQILDSAALRSHLFSTRKITLAPFCIAKREQWLKHYMELGEMIPAETLEYVRNLTDQDSDGVANTPLALYLLVHCNFRDEFRDNLWALYHTIFSDAIIKTYYNTPVLGSDPVLNQAEATLNYAMVKEIAYTMFRNSGYDRFHITRQELDECAKAVGLEGADAERVKQTCVLCAYWKNSTDGALEFYHNNIRDFFLCEYICDQILEVVREMPDDLGSYTKNSYSYGTFLHEECMDPRWTPLVKLCCSILSWCKIAGSTWKRVFQMIALRISAESTQPDDTHTLYAHFLRNPILLQLPNALLATPHMWSTEYSDHPYYIAKITIANAVALWHVLMCILSPNLSKDNHTFHYTIICNRILRDWNSLFQEQINISPFGVMSLFSYSSLYSINWDNMIFQQVDFSKCFLGNISFNGSIFRGANFSYCDMDSIELHDGILQGCIFNKAEIVYSQFDDAQIEACSMSSAVFRKTNFCSATIRTTETTNTRLRECSFAASSMHNVISENVVFKDCNLDLAIISSSKFTNTSFSDCTFNGTTFRDITLKNCHIDGNKTRFKGCSFHNVIAQNCTYRNLNSITAARVQAIGFTEGDHRKDF